MGLFKKAWDEEIQQEDLQRIKTEPITPITPQPIQEQPIEQQEPEKQEEPEQIHEPEGKLNWIQKISAKKMMKAYKKKLENVKQISDEERAKKEKPKLVKALAELTEMLEFENEETGEIITTTDLQTMEINELIEMLDEALKILKTKI